MDLLQGSLREDAGGGEEGRKKRWSVGWGTSLWVTSGCPEGVVEGCPHATPAHPSVEEVLSSKWINDC